MQQGEYNSYYHQYPQFQNPNPNLNPNPNPNPNPAPADLTRNTYASAPPYTGAYSATDYSGYPQNYPPYSQNSDHGPPSAPSYTPGAQPHPPLPTETSLNPNSYSSSFNQSPAVPTPASSYVPFDSAPPYQQSTGQPPYFPAYDQHQTTSGYANPPLPAGVPNPNPVAVPPFSSSLYSGPPYSATGASVPPSYESSYDNPVKYDQPGYGSLGRSRSDVSSDLYGKRSESGGYSGYEDSYGDGIYAYEGGKVEPYGARGTAPKPSNSTLFDDYGRSINSYSSGRDSSASLGSSKIVRAVPKADTQEDVKSGVQKFRVKLLAETYGQTTMDVLCEIGLDGIRMLDPSTNRTLRIYPLENVTRCEKLDSSILAFWSKSPVDIEPKRIRLQSNSYTSNTLLDTVTAAMFQAKEIGGSSRPLATVKPTEQNGEKKKGIVDWMNIVKPANEEKDHWVPDEAVSKCTSCGTDFGAFVRRHHCRNCGDIFCDKCTQGRIALTAEDNAPQVRVCDRCMAEVTQRICNVKEAANRSVGLQSHEDLARKLHEEMEKNRKSSSGSRGGSGRRMKEVACPTCTVHLQVQVPISGSETIECGVCQSPFLVSAH